MNEIKPLLTTERLIIRKIVPEDDEFIYRLWNDKVIVEQLGNRGISNVELARKWIIENPMKSYIDNGFGLYVVVLKDTLVQIGLTGLVNRPNKIYRTEEINIGFSLLCEYRNQGYCYESSKACVEYGQKELHLFIVGQTSVSNLRSRNTIEKLGFVFCKNFMDVSGDAVLYIPANNTLPSNVTPPSTIDNTIKSPDTVPTLQRYIIIQILNSIVDHINRKKFEKEFLNTFTLISKEWNEKILPNLSCFQKLNQLHREFKYFRIRFNCNFINTLELKDFRGCENNINKIAIRPSKSNDHKEIIDKIPKENIESISIVARTKEIIYDQLNLITSINDNTSTGNGKYYNNLKEMNIGTSSLDCKEIIEIWKLNGCDKIENFSFSNPYPNSSQGLYNMDLLNQVKSLTSVDLSFLFSELSMIPLIRYSTSITDMKLNSNSLPEQGNSIEETLKVLGSNKNLKSFSFSGFYNTMVKKRLVVDLFNENRSLENLSFSFKIFSDVNESFEIHNSTLKSFQIGLLVDSNNLMPLWKSKSNIRKYHTKSFDTSKLESIQEYHTNLSDLTIGVDKNDTNLISNLVFSIFKLNLLNLTTLKIKNELLFYPQLLKEIQYNKTISSLEIQSMSSSQIIEFLDSNHQSIINFKCEQVAIWNYTEITNSLAKNHTIQSLSLHTQEKREFCSIYFMQLIHVLENNNTLTSLDLPVPSQEFESYNIPDQYITKLDKSLSKNTILNLNIYISRSPNPSNTIKSLLQMLNKYLINT